MDRALIKAVVAASVAFGCAGVHAQMNTTGSFSVSPGGAATYSLPITLPSGVAGMEPKLALAYSSQSGNGLLGLGWNLTGLSGITRCQRTLLQDNVSAWQTATINRIYYNSTNDRYCLDGQRLILVAGTEGAGGAEYRTESDAASKIVAASETGATGGPGSFTVWTKAGLKMEYGRTADSRVEVQGSSVVGTWALNKVSDTKGNYFSVTYTEDNANGQYYPSRIDYTANAAAGIAAKTIVYFDYGARADVSHRYYEDKISKTTVILQAIRVVDATSNQTVISYQLSYNPAADSKVSQLTSIARCAGSTANCLPPITLGYDAAVLAPVSFTVNGHGTGDQGWQVADLFGDGKPVYWTHNSAGQHFATRISETGAVQNWTWNGHGVGNGGWRLVDLFGTGQAIYWTRNDFKHNFNRFSPNGVETWSCDGHGGGDRAWDFGNMFGDGRQVYWTANSSGQHFVTRLNPNGTCENFTFNGGIIVGPKWRLVDLFGTGRDVVWAMDGAGKHYGTELIENAGLQSWSWDGHGDSGEGWDFGDLFGDGRQLYWTHNSNGTHFITRLNHDTPAQSWTLPGGHGIGNGGYKLVDLYGDGRKYYWSRQDLQHYVTRFDPGSLQNFQYSGQGGADGGWEFVKMFGDGRDVYWTHDGFGNHYATAFNLNGTVTNSNWTGHGVETDRQIVDFFGAGQFHYWVHLGFSHRVTRFVSGYPGVLKSVNNGLGSTVQIAVDALPKLNGSLYAPGTSAYPRVALSSPLPVVKSVKTSDGVGGQRESVFSYGNGQVEVGPKGRGFLGFQWTQQKDVSTGLVSRTFYRQDFPFIGMPYMSGRGTSEGAWNNLELTQTMYSFMSVASSDAAVTCSDTAFGARDVTCSQNNIVVGKRYVVYPNRVDTQSNDLNGTALPGTRVLNQNVDIYGNVKTVTTQTLSPSGTATEYSKTVTNVYAEADKTKWIHGRLLSSKVDAAGPVPGNSGLITISPPATAAVAGALNSVFLLLLND